MKYIIIGIIISLLFFIIYKNYNRDTFEDYETLCSDKFTSTHRHIGYYYSKGVLSLQYPGQPTIIDERCKNIITKAKIFTLVDYDFVAESFLKGFNKLESFDFSFFKKYKSIGNEAFMDCTSLKTIKLPPNLEIIGYSTFKNCKILKNIDLPESLKSIGMNAFENCGLTNITLSSNIKIINDSCFKNCSSLETIDFNGSTIYKIGNNAFENCSKLKLIKNMNIAITPNNSIFEIGSFAFKNCKNLTEFSVPVNNTVIGESAFEGCLQFKNLNFDTSFIITYMLPKNINIGKNAFKDTQLTYLDLSDIYYIDENLFNIKDMFNGMKINFIKVNKLSTLSVLDTIFKNTVNNRIDVSIKDCTNLTEITTDSQSYNKFHIKCDKIHIPKESQNVPELNSTTTPTTSTTTSKHTTTTTTSKHTTTTTNTEEHTTTTPCKTTTTTISFPNNDTVSSTTSSIQCKPKIINNKEELRKHICSSVTCPPDDIVNNGNESSFEINKQKIRDILNTLKILDKTTTVFPTTDSNKTTENTKVYPTTDSNKTTENTKVSPLDKTTSKPINYCNEEPTIIFDKEILEEIGEGIFCNNKCSNKNKMNEESIEKYEDKIKNIIKDMNIFKFLTSNMSTTTTKTTESKQHYPQVQLHRVK
jgi:hypothetical protein